jgi:putative PIN family toxin of toxin-antitoxin system
MMQIVLDTNVLVSALLSQRGASYQILRLIRQGVLVLHLSVPLVCEYEDVLKRNNARYALSLSDEEIDELLDILCFLGVQHPIWYLWRPLLNDTKDDFVAELAITARVDCIVTHNSKDFKKIAPFNILILTPKELLEKIGDQL